MITTKLLWLVALLSLTFALMACSGEDASDRAAEGAALVEQGRWQEAIVELDLAIDQYITNIGYQKTTGRHAAAKVIEFEEAEALVDRSTAHMELGQSQLALKDLDKAVKLRPDYAPAYANRALVQTRLGKDAEAEQDVSQAASLGYDVTGLQRRIDNLKAAR